MKDILPLRKVVWCVAILSLGALVGCSDKDNPSGPRQNPLIGTWNMSDAVIAGFWSVTPSDSNNVQLVLRSDSSYSLMVIALAQRTDDAETWTSTDSVLTLRNLAGTVRTVSYTLAGTTSMTAKMKVPASV